MMRVFSPSRFFTGAALAALLLACGGCLSVPYHYGKDLHYVHGPALPAGESQISYGRPNKLLDASGWIWPGSLLTKLILWNHKMDSHRFSTQTVAAVQTYLADNELREVKIRVNEYDVRGEWRRTLHNTSIGCGWRYTTGLLAWLGYTILPGRFFGGDNYNPYSNTVNLYSDLIPVVLHECGHSKDFAYANYKGTYAFAYGFIPLFNLYPEAKASSDALSYLRAKGDAGQEKEAYTLLYPAYATYLGGNAGSGLSTPWAYALEAAFIIPAHIVGRVKAAHVPDPLPPQPPPRHEGESGAATPAE